MIDYDLDEVSHSNAGVAFIHLMASVRTVKAILVYTMLGMIFILLIQDKTVPEFLKSGLLMITGTFFEFVKSNGRSRLPQKAPTLPTANKGE